MPDASVATPGTSADVVVRLTRTEGTVDIPNNRSFLTVTLRLVVTAYNGSGGPFNNNNNSRGIVDTDEIGELIDVTKSYDLRSGVSSSILWGSWSGWVDHDEDGTKTIHFDYDFIGGNGTPLGNGGGSSTLVLSNIPRYGAEEYDGVAWEDRFAERWDGSAWVLQATEEFDGSTWVIRG
jgi:hypothetical protein